MKLSLSLLTLLLAAMAIHSAHLNRGPQRHERSSSDSGSDSGSDEDNTANCVMSQNCSVVSDFLSTIDTNDQLASYRLLFGDASVSDAVDSTRELLAQANMAATGVDVSTLDCFGSFTPGGSTLALTSIANRFFDIELMSTDGRDIDPLPPGAGPGEIGMVAFENLRVAYNYRNLASFLDMRLVFEIDGNGMLVGSAQQQVFFNSANNGAIAFNPPMPFPLVLDVTVSEKDKWLLISTNTRVSKCDGKRIR